MSQEALGGSVAEFDVAVQERACPYLNQLGEVALGEIRGVYEQLDAGNYDMLGELAERLAAAAGPDQEKHAEIVLQPAANDVAPKAEDHVTLKADTLAQSAQPQREALANDIIKMREPQRIIQNKEIASDVLPAINESTAFYAKEPENNMQTGYKKNLAEPAVQAELPREKDQPPEVQVITEVSRTEPKTEMQATAIVDSEFETSFEPHDNGVDLLGGEVLAQAEVVTNTEAELAGTDEQGHVQEYADYEQEEIKYIVHQQILELADEQQQHEDSTQISLEILVGQAETASGLETTDFEVFIAEDAHEAPSMQAVETLAENEEPLERTLAVLAEVIKHTDELPDNISEILDEVEICLDEMLSGQAEEDGQFRFSTEYTAKMLELIKALGYENPPKVLLDFARNKGLSFMVQASSCLTKISRECKDRSTASDLAVPMSAGDSRQLRIAKILFGFMIRTLQNA